MVNISKSARAHPTFPLTSQALNRLSLTPEFSYSDPSNARTISGRLEPSFESFTPAEYIAIGLIGKAFLSLIKHHKTSNNPNLFHDLDAYLSDTHDSAINNSFLETTLNTYPTTFSYYHPDSIDAYLVSNSTDTDFRHSLYSSLLLVNAASENPSITRYDKIFVDHEYFNSSDYQRILKSLVSFLNQQSTHGEKGQNIIEFLAAPAKAHPNSLFDQLNFIKLNWSEYLDLSFMTELLRALDHFKEEHIHSFSNVGGFESPLGFSKATYLSDEDQVRFSQDLDWMPNLVLIAKNVFVWLDQLSRKYRQPIYRLDEIPDIEFKQLSTWGITGLWMIGVWERSSASQKIKQLCGNVDAVPSAYSLYDYSIAEALGGEAAFLALSEKAKSHGIRLAADMVPNHMGIHSKWVIDHPGRFLSLDQSPFPNYKFNGQNLSDDPGVDIYIDDHYYDQTDAAVVFKRLDKLTGSEKYIYHGNDGTSMPWNDTAQLDFLNPETRESVIQAIIHVARKFPIIRFDAAMTLAKKHFQRLWFPEPGTGGAIPTRAEHGLSKEQFDDLMPFEFWQEVVDRVAQEVPDTLLLAEAFWMMEGYFVRTLGMHRVYNSAFMHMLRDEDNHKYRDLISSTLEFDPQILKRYVNFMNNPDEETALTQFGANGKYFSICVIMATMPGLPMFGHGQIEGFAEKYGMEYHRAYYDEMPNQDLIDRHTREIFPLLKKRHIFAEVDNFYLYDFCAESGKINDNVIVYSNLHGEERSLVICHNKWDETKGYIHNSTPINGNSVSFLTALDLVDHTADFILFRDHITGLEYVRAIDDLQTDGLELSLGAYQYKVLWDFKLIKSEDDSYFKLNQNLQGEGTINIQDILQEIQFESTLTAMNALFNFIKASSDHRESVADHEYKQALPFRSGLDYLLQTIFNRMKNIYPDLPVFIPDIKINQLVNLVHVLTDFDHHKIPIIESLAFFILFEDIYSNQHNEFLKTLANLLGKQIRKRDNDREVSIWENQKALIVLNDHIDDLPLNPKSLINFYFDKAEIKEFLMVHNFEVEFWFNKESFEALLDLTINLFLLKFSSPDKKTEKNRAKDIKQYLEIKQSILDLMAKSNYLVEPFIDLANNFNKT